MSIRSQFSSPVSLTDALEALAEDDVTVLAGGTDVYPALVGKDLPGHLLDISGIRALQGLRVVERDDGVFLRIGACTSWTAIAEATLGPGFAALQQVATQIGAVQVQNAGTIAGNLCTASPAGDGIPVLLALDARIELQSTRNARVVPMASFITGYRTTARAADELVVAVEIPIRESDHVSAFVKFGTRSHLVISLAMVAASVVRDASDRIVDARVAVGACSAVAQRLESVENRVVAAEPVRIGVDDLSVLSPLDDIRCSARFRRVLVVELVGRALTACGVAVA